LIATLLGVSEARPRILDIGSGQGDQILELRSRYPDAELCGIDYSQAGVEIARVKVPTATFIRRDLVLPEGPPPSLKKWATYSICSEVLEHVDDPRALLTNAIEYMAEGCRLVVTVPGGPMSAFDRHLGHRRHFTADSLREVLTDSGFRVDRVIGAGFPFFNLYRTVVILRGKRLVTDVAKGELGAASPLASGVMRIFTALLRFNPMLTNKGWQMVAVASVPARAGRPTE
jgi:SAM-dependent methyltransferase